MRLVCTLLALWSGFSVFAQVTDVKFHQLTIEHGLVSNEIKSLFSDSEGFIWIGTRNGLSRFDGKNFKNYKHNPEDSSSISNNYIWHIHETKDGLLWFGTKNGLTILNKRTDKFTTYYHQKNNVNSLTDNDVREVLEDDKGIFWLGTRNGLTRFDRKTLQFTRYKIPSNRKPDDEKKEIPNPIWAMWLDRNGVLWVGSARGLFTFDRVKGTFHLEPYKFRQGDNTFFEIFEDDQNYLWASTNGGGVYMIPPNRNRAEVLLFKRDSVGNRGFSGDATNKIRQDKHGLVWFLHTENGISVYNHQTKRFTNYEKNARNTHSLSNNAMQGFCEDQSGNIWVGTYQSGLNYFDNRRGGKNTFELFQHSLFAPQNLPDQAVAAIFEDSEGLLWIGTYGKGISVYNPHLQTYTNYTQQNTNGELCTDLIAGFEEDDKGNIWVATAKCTSYFDKKSDKFSNKISSLNPENEQELFAGTLSAIHKDSAGVFYFGGGSGVFRLANNDLKNWYEIKDQNGIEHKLDKNAPIIAAPNGSLWIGKGAANKGIFSFDKKTAQFTHYLLEPDKPYSLADENIYDLALDSKGTLWVTTSEGLYFKEKNSTKFLTIKEKDGLPTNMLYTIVIDSKDRLWLASSLGICCVSRQPKGKIRVNRYDLADGAVGADQTHIRYSKWVNKNGYICFGGSKGFCKFHPDSIQENRTVPPVVFTSFKLFEKEYSLDTAITYKKYITLTHEQNFLSFEFAALNFIRPDKNQYAYKIDGLNENWIPLGNKNAISIAGLEPDTYILRVKASNNDGLWNEEGASMHITILPPWWATWWFISLIISIIFLIIYGIYQYRIKEIRKEETYKNEINKVKDTYQNLQNDFQEVNQRLNTSRIDSHFLANCMGLINNYISKGDNQAAQAAMDDLNKLHRLVLYHTGKKYITLKEELDFLEIYVRMSQRRFEDSFDYQVINENSVDLRTIEIPPLLLQPFVENAILHGLRNKKERGKLQLKIFVQDEILHILIEDDGVGRSKASEINGLSRQHHQSLGMEITEKRLREMIDGQVIDNLLEIIDLKDDKNTSLGTQVVVRIPM